MNTMMAFMKGVKNKNKEQMVFDWIKAAKLILENNAKYAAAGLRGDWEYTGGRIFADGKPIKKEDTYTYLSSTWAVPELEIDGIRVECYCMQSKAPKWGSETYWPSEALAILESGGKVEEEK